jgi:hypothetical protein
MVRDKSFSHHDSREALQQQGRAVGRLVNRSGRPYLDNLLYELVNDPEVQAEFSDSLGLCERHAYLMLDAGDGLATPSCTAPRLGSCWSSCRRFPTPQGRRRRGVPCSDVLTRPIRTSPCPGLVDSSVAPRRRRRG